MLAFGGLLALQGFGGFRAVLAGFSPCVVEALAEGSGLVPTSPFGPAVSLFPLLGDRLGFGSLVLSPWVPMLAQALAIQFLAQA